jgi:hypothetical protein
MARASMADLISHLRLLVHDPAGDDQTFSDDEIQTFLDQHQTEVRYLRLIPVETIQSGGSVVNLAYRAAVGWWEDTVSLYDRSYDELTPDSEDLQTGRWAFAAHQAEPVYLTGYTYDLYGAAIDCLTAWAAQLKFSYDFTADGATFRRSQQLASINGLIARYSALVGPQVAIMTRDDVIG